MDDSIPDDAVLSCGCVIRCAVIDGVNTLTMVACREGCRNVAMALEEADAQGKPVTVREW